MPHPCSRCLYRRWISEGVRTSCARTMIRNPVANQLGMPVVIAPAQSGTGIGHRLFLRFMAMRVQSIFCEVKKDE